MTLRGASYYDDEQTRSRRHQVKPMVPEPLADLKSFGRKLASGFAGRMAETIQDPKGNFMSVKSTGHIHHPDRLGAIMEEGKLGVEKKRVTVAQLAPLRLDAVWEDQDSGASSSQGEYAVIETEGAGGDEGDHKAETASQSSWILPQREVRAGLCFRDVI